ncbi:MAG: hypothetical protein RL095_2326 [Verrucomicrobiota bacterium]|jgi:alpha-galactosidase
MMKSLQRLRLLLILLAAAALPGLAAEAEPGARKKPLKVFILAGQSNMEGHARLETFDYIGDDPATAPLLKRMRGDDGKPRVCDHVWISYFTGRFDGSSNGEGLGRLTAGFGARKEAAKSDGKIGPEFTFGLTMEAAFAEPVLIIKTAWGGKSLHTDFRPPGAGPYQLNETQIKRFRGSAEERETWLAKKQQDTGRFYRLMVEHVKRVLADPKRVCPAYDPAAGCEIAGFVWLQGFNDMVDQDTYPKLPQGSPANRFALYGELLGHFIRDVRKDFGAPDMPFVIGVLGIDGLKANPDVLAFREAMAAPALLPEFKGRVAAVATAPFWPEELAAIDAKHGKLRQMAHFLDSRHKDYANADGRMSDAEKRDFLKKYEAELITPAEAALWKRGASNAGYHYLGCAKTFALMGRHFAEANLEMLRTPRPAFCAAEPEEPQQLEAQLSERLKSLQAEIAASLPRIDEARNAALRKAREGVKAAETEAAAAQRGLEKIQTAQALVDHAKGKWLGGAAKGIAAAEEALKKAATEAEREAARKDLAKWQADQQAGLKALTERQAALDQALREQSGAKERSQAAQERLAAARAAERSAAQSLLADLAPFLSSGDLDEKLLPAAVLAAASPRGLADFARTGPEQEALVKQLLGDPALMKQMLEAGGAKSGKYGRAMEIYSAIRKASPRAAEGLFQRLALATSLEHAVPVPQKNALAETDAPGTIDPVKRYLHYEKAWLDGELDPAFENFSAWEYRMVVGCDAPDRILAWGREMLRNYRPDHVANPDYGWRYSACVRTEVKYGSQNVKDDLPQLNEYQNIPKNGGVCGRRAFFGRFILRSFGIPTWGVTQHAHAALSHWTPKGWVVNLGAGFQHSWWDKDEAPRSGSDFLLETQARAHARDYAKVLRAKWISAALGEQAYNARKGIAGGLWSGIAQDQTAALAAAAVPLGPLGQESAEADEAKVQGRIEPVKKAPAEEKILVDAKGLITLPALAASKSSGPAIAMKSFAGGTQLHCSGGFKASYTLEVPRAGDYELSARVATIQEGQKFLLRMNGAKTPEEIAVPCTLGLWQQTPALKLSLAQGKNIVEFAVRDGSRGVSLKEFTLRPLP